MLKTLRIATRKSALAQLQAAMVKRKIETAFPEMDIQYVNCSTAGDEIQNRPLAEIGGKGLFIKSLEEALLGGSADLAVHSLKDVPSLISDEFSLMAFVERENPFDVMLSQQFKSLADLPLFARVGTSSPRRSAQLKWLRPDLRIALLRGNVPTRVEKVMNQELDAGIFAYAGLARLGLTEKIRQIFPPNTLLPAPGQGIIVVECLRAREAEFKALISVLNDTKLEKMALAERAFAARLSGDCYSAIAAVSEVNGDQLKLRGAVYSKGGETALFGSKILDLSAEVDAFEALGQALADELLGRGARELLCFNK